MVFRTKVGATLITLNKIRPFQAPLIPSGVLVSPRHTGPPRSLIQPGPASESVLPQYGLSNCCQGQRKPSFLPSMGKSAHHRSEDLMKTGLWRSSQFQGFLCECVDIVCFILCSFLVNMARHLPCYETVTGIEIDPAQLHQQPLRGSLWTGGSLRRPLTVTVLPLAKLLPQTSLPFKTQKRGPWLHCH